MSNGAQKDTATKVYVLDTSAIIDYPDCITKLADGGNFVVIPQIVTEELDNLKKKDSDVRFAAREAVEKISQLKDEGLMNHGLDKALIGEDSKRLDNGGAVFWESRYTALDDKVFERSKNDNIILACCRFINGKTQGSSYSTVLITEDIDLSIKADSLSEFDVQKLKIGKAKLTRPEEVYQGVREVFVESKTIEDFIASGDFKSRSLAQRDIPELNGAELLWNEGVLLTDKYNTSRIVPTKFNPEKGGKLLELVRGTYWDTKNLVYKPMPVLGITPSEKDFRQALFFEFALDPDIKFLLCYGKAGTGKTSCAAAAAIKCWTDYNAGNINIPGNNKYQNGIFIMRPEYSSSNTEIAAVPGGINLKTKHWVEPVMDKLTEQVKSLNGKSCELQKIVTLGNSGLLRGKDLKDLYIIFDEFQNAGRQLSEVAMTRVHESSKCVIMGDIDQIDNHYLTWRNCAITLNAEFLKGKHPAIAVVNLTQNYRNPLMKLIAGVKDYRI